MSAKKHKEQELLLQRIIHRARQQGFINFRDLVRMFPTEASVEETSRLVDTLADLGIQVRYGPKDKSRPDITERRPNELLTREQEVTLARRVRSGQQRRVKAAMRCPRTVNQFIRAANQVASGSRRLWDLLADYEGSHPDSDSAEARRRMMEVAQKLKDRLSEITRLTSPQVKRKQLSNRADRIRALRGSMTRLLNQLDFRERFINQLLRPLAAETARAEKAVLALTSLEKELELTEGALGASQQIPDSRIRGLIRKKPLSHQEKEQVKRKVKKYKRAIRAAEKKTKLGANDLLKIGRDVRLGEREANLARQTMVEANQRLVFSIARRYPHYSMDFLDLVQEGNLGLMRAADRFDPDRGFRFGTYAAWWVRQSIGRLVAEQGSAVRIPPHVQESLHKINRIMRRLVLKTGKEPSIEDLAERLGKSPHRIKEIILAGRRPISTDSKVGDSEDSASFLDFIPDPRSDPEAEADQRVKQAVLQDAMDALSDREQEIIMLRFNQGLTLQEVGNQFGITRERTRQLQAQALEKLRKRLKADLLRKLIRDEPLKVDGPPKTKARAGRRVPLRAALKTRASTAPARTSAAKKTTPRKTAIKEAATKKTTTKKTAPKKTTTKKAATKKTTTRKAAPKKTTTKKAAPKKTTTKKAAPKKTTTKKAAPKKTTTKKAAPKKTTTKKAATKKTTTKKAAPKKTTTKKAAPKKTTTRKAAAKKTATKKTTARKTIIRRPGTRKIAAKNGRRSRRAPTTGKGSDG